MSGKWRWMLAGLTAALALVGPCAGAAQAKFFGGMVPDVPSAGAVSAGAPVAIGAHAPARSGPIARIANLPYSGGAVLHSNRTHLIFWQPPVLGFDPGFGPQVETFLARVAADSRRPTNVYGLSGQYRDSAGPAAYNSSYAGAVLDTDPLPSNDCTEPSYFAGGPGWSVCLSDHQLENEIARVIAERGLPRGANDVYFLVTPNGLGSCVQPGSGSSCALGGSSNGGYCGYHSQDGSILYAVIPYSAVPGHCQSDNPRPNASTADPVISMISHEHNETVTDPSGDAWIDSAGNENGDLCLTVFGPNIGGSGAGAWNETIDGGHYYLQEEFSNEDASCRPRDESDRISFSAPRNPRARKRLTLSARASDPDGAIVAYYWSFGDGRSHSRSRRASHAFRRPGVYRVVLRTTDRVGNWAFYTRRIRVRG